MPGTLRLRSDLQSLLLGMVIVAACLWIYSPAFQGDWLWDDNVLITENPLMKDQDGLWKIWFQPGVFIDYYPLTFTVQRLEWNLWGLDPLGYHLVNVALHAVSALLAWRLFHRLGLRLAWWGGLLFAVHPLQVESVAWMAELKNALSMPPILLAMCAWIDFDARGKSKDYVLALVLFAVAMLCKITVVMLPLIILLYTWWKRGGIRWFDLKLSAPFFVLALAVGLIPIASGIWDHTFNHLNPDVVPVAHGISRVVLIGSEVGFYFVKSILPIGLLPIYPKWQIDPTSPPQYLPLIIMLGLFFILWNRRKTWGRHVLFGLGFFLVNLLPCPGFIPAPNMPYAWVMDHFMYLPIVGLIGLGVAGASQFASRLPERLRPICILMAVGVTLLLSVGSHRYARLYRDSRALWTYTLRHNPDSWMVRMNLGESLLQQGHLAQAIEQFEMVTRTKPGFIGGHFDLGNAFSQAGRYTDAVAQYDLAKKLNPGFANVSYYNGLALEHLGRSTDAGLSYQTALHFNPGLADAHAHLASLLFKASRYPEAIGEFTQAVQLDNSRPEYHSGLAHALLTTNELPQAIDEYEQALQLNPNDAVSLSNLGVALARTGHIPEAQTQLEASIHLDPKNAEAHNNLGSIYLVMGQLPKAEAEYRTALVFQPGFAAAQKNLARVQALQKQRAGAKP